MRRGEQRKANHADVEERGGKGRNGEAVPGIQDGTHQRRQRNQQNIGEGYTQQLGGQGKFIRCVSKPGAVTMITQGAASIPRTVTIASASVSNPET